jgi:hypothetical protein
LGMARTDSFSILPTGQRRDDMKIPAYRAILARDRWMFDVFKMFADQPKEGSGWGSEERRVEKWVAKAVGHVAFHNISDLDQSAVCWESTVEVGSISVTKGGRRKISTTLSEQFVIVGYIHRYLNGRNSFFTTDMSQSMYQGIKGGYPELLEGYMKSCGATPKAVVKFTKLEVTSFYQTVSFDVYKYPPGFGWQQIS